MIARTNTLSGFFAIIATSHASGLVLENTFSEAAATLAVKQGFVTSESQAGAGASCVDLSGFGRGGPTRKDGRTASDVFSTPRPPDALENADGGFLHVPEGAETMTASTPKNGPTSHVNTTDVPAQSTPWTPAHHTSVNKTKPIRLLELGEGEYGKNARLEFPEGWQRTIDLPTEADTWHPLFSELSLEDRQKLHRHVQQPALIGPNGVRRQSMGLSFTTRTLTRNGYSKDFNYFDVPSEDYFEGRITGYRCGAELLDAYKRGYGPHFNLTSIIQHAVEATKGSITEESCRGAAYGFLGVIEEAVKFLAKHGKYDNWLTDKIASEESNIALFAKHEAQEKAAFVERMRKARAAKREARKEGGAR